MQQSDLPGQVTSEGWENKTSGSTKSCWFTDAVSLQFQKLVNDVAAEIVVVGGGIAGITAAYLQQKVILRQLT